MTRTSSNCSASVEFFETSDSSIFTVSKLSEVVSLKMSSIKSLSIDCVGPGLLGASAAFDISALELSVVGISVSLTQVLVAESVESTLKQNSSPVNSGVSSSFL